MRIHIDQLERLQSDEGRQLLSIIAARNPSPTDSLALITELRKRWDPELVSAAMTIHSLRQRAAPRFRDAGRLWLTGEGLEQASSDIVADHRAARYAGCARVADLCCGIGGDLMALTRRTDIGSLLAVDRDPLHVTMAGLNARLVRPDVDLTTVVSDAETVDLAKVDGVFLDPARRRGGRRVGEDRASPPLDWALGLVDRVEKVGVTTAPGIDHELVPEGWELEMAAIGSDLKEGTLWSPALATTRRRATVLDPRTGRVTTLIETPGDDVGVTEPEEGMTVLDPNPAVTRASLVQDLARQLEASMIDPQIAFLVTASPVTSPLARTMTIVASLPWHEREVKARLRELGAGAVDVRRRGLAGDVDAIARRLRGTGDRRYTVLMTRHRDQPWAIITEDPGRA